MKPKNIEVSIEKTKESLINKYIIKNINTGEEKLINEEDLNANFSLYEKEKRLLNSNNILDGKLLDLDKWEQLQGKYSIEILHEKEYKICIDKVGKKVAYPKNTHDNVIDILEKNRQNKNFVSINLGNIETGESWGEENDVKGQLGLSKGNEAYYPLLIAFNEDYDYLNEKSLKSIKKEIEAEDIEWKDTLSDGGGMLVADCIVGVKKGLEGKAEYVHPKLHSKYDYNLAILEEETIKVTETRTNTYSSSTKEKEKIEIAVFVPNKKNNNEVELIARFDDKTKAIDWLNMNLEQLNLTPYKQKTQLKTSKTKKTPKL